MSLEDKMDILEMIARYSYTYDGRDTDGFAALFATNGVFEVIHSGSDQPELRLESRAAIQSWASQRHQSVVHGIHDRHHQSGTLFDDLTPAQAQTRTMILITHQGANDPVPRPVLTGVYHDHWQKTDRGWQLTQRSLRHDHHHPYLSR